MINYGGGDYPYEALLKLQTEDCTRRYMTRIRAAHIRMLSAAHRNFYHHPDGSRAEVMAIQKQMMDRKIVIGKLAL